MDAPRWIHISTNKGYHESVAALVAAIVAKDVVAGCVAAVTTP